MNNLIQRSFTVGDNWLYYKIYTGSRTSDMILLDIIKPLTESLLNDDVIDKSKPKTSRRKKINLNLRNVLLLSKLVVSLMHRLAYIMLYTL